MKKEYELVQINICMMDPQDIVMSSVLIEWGDDWQTDDDTNDYIFG